MKCINCEHEQQAGKFCGKCGTPMAEQSVQSEVAATVNVEKPQSPPIPSVEPKVHMEKVKESSKQYWSYFLQHLKRPSAVIDQSSAQTSNAFISIGLFILIISLSVYKNLSSMYQSTAGMFLEGGGPSLPSVVVSTAFPLALLLFLSIGIQFLVSKFSGPALSFKQTAVINGALLVPSIAILATSYVLLLMNSLVFGNFLFAIGIVFSCFIMPLFAVTAVIRTKSHTVDSFYAFISYIVLFTISFVLTLSILADSALGQMISEIQGILGFL